MCICSDNRKQEKLYTVMKTDMKKIYIVIMTSEKKINIYVVFSSEFNAYLQCINVIFSTVNALK